MLISNTLHPRNVSLLRSGPTKRVWVEYERGVKS